MEIIRRAKSGECLIGRLTHGCDLLEELTRICVRYGVRLGTVHALGAVQRARIGYYDQGKKEYRFIEFDRHMEIVQLVGNVSVRDAKPMVHAHVTLADDQGRAFGGHLAPGTVVFACEVEIQPLEGTDLVRELDEETGLPLWRG